MSTKLNVTGLKEAAADIVEHTTKQNENVLAVWDIDSEGWRSFRIDSVKEVILNKIDSIL